MNVIPGSFNHITLVGRLTRDPELRYVQSGTAVCSFSMAINRRTKQGDEAMFVDCVAWDSGSRTLATTCNNYLNKGSFVLIDGRLSIREYTAKDGSKRKATEIVVNDMQMLDSRASSEARGSGGGGSRSSGSDSDWPGNSGQDDDGEIPFLVDPREERERFMG